MTNITEAARQLRVATYIRISTDEENQPFSLGAQELRLGAYIQSQDGWRLVRQYSDRITGSRLDRPGLQQALSDARSGSYDVLLVYRVDRLARSVRGLAQILEELDRANVSFRSATEPFDTASPAGRMMVQMLGVFAEFERATIIDRVVAGMERKAARGGWNGGAVPFGYRLEDGRLAPHPDRAHLVPMIFELYARKRMGARAVAEWLNKRGHRTSTGHTWGYKTLLTILRNRAYVGEVRFRGHLRPQAHPPLVDEATFTAVQQLIDERGEDPGKRRSNGSDYLLSGLVRCRPCGRHYVGTAAHGRGGRYVYYTCQGRVRFGQSSCDAERLPADQLDQAVIRTLVSTLVDHKLIDEAVAAARARAAEDEPNRREQRIAGETELGRTEEKLRRYFAAFEAGTLSDVQCAPRIAGLTEQIEQLKTRLAELAAPADALPEPPPPEELSQIAARLEAALLTGDRPEVKALLHALVAEVVVDSRDRITPVFRVPVRILGKMVGGEGLEPSTSALSALRSAC